MTNIGDLEHGELARHAILAIRAELNSMQNKKLLRPMLILNAFIEEIVAQMKQGTADNHIKHMVERFLAWKLPIDFRPDAGISFKAEYNEHTEWPMRHEPVGTNLLTATQAEAMVRHMIEGIPPEPLGSSMETPRG